MKLALAVLFVLLAHAATADDWEAVLLDGKPAHLINGIAVLDESNIAEYVDVGGRTSRPVAYVSKMKKSADPYPSDAFSFSSYFDEDDEVLPLPAPSATEDPPPTELQLKLMKLHNLTLPPKIFPSNSRHTLRPEETLLQ